MMGPVSRAYLWPANTFLGLLTCVLLSVVGSCSAEISDLDIAQEFTRNKALFDQIVRIGLSTDLSCYESTGNVATCSNPTATATFDALRSLARIKAIHARHGLPEPGDTVCFVVAEYGMLTTNSYTKGLVYSASALQPIVESTDDHPDLKYRFKRIANHWYVFTMP